MVGEVEGVREGERSKPAIMRSVTLFPSVLAHFYHKFGYDETILLTLRRIYEGWKINDLSLYYLLPHMSFRGCIKSANKKNEYEKCVIIMHHSGAWSERNLKMSIGPNTFLFHEFCH